MAGPQIETYVLNIIYKSKPVMPRFICPTLVREGIGSSSNPWDCLLEGLSVLARVLCVALTTSQFIPVAASESLLLEREDRSFEFGTTRIRSRPQQRRRRAGR